LPAVDQPDTMRQDDGRDAMSPMSFPYFTCRQMVGLVTDYLEDRLDVADRLRFESHIAVCGPCRAYLRQMRETIRVTGELREEDVSDEAREHLLSTFRDWNAER
jgi:anti-sigma factor RsiW